MHHIYIYTTLRTFCLFLDMKGMYLTSPTSQPLTSCLVCVCFVHFEVIVCIFNTFWLQFLPFSVFTTVFSCCDMFKLKSTFPLLYIHNKETSRYVLDSSFSRYMIAAGEGFHVFVL